MQGVEFKLGEDGVAKCFGCYSRAVRDKKDGAIGHGGGDQALTGSGWWQAMTKREFTG